MVLLCGTDGERLKRVLLLATTTGYQIRSFGDAADKLGVRLVFASDRCDQIDDPWWDQAIPIRFHEESRSIHAVVAAARPWPDGILAVGDRPVVLAAHLARHYGLPWHSPEGAAKSRHKLLTREAFRAAGLPTPVFRSVSLNADPETLAHGLPYPVVVKPQSLAGSRGVIRADDEVGFIAAFERLRTLLQLPDVQQEHDPAHDGALIESFIPGREYAVEGLMTGGRLQLLTIFDKPDPLDGPFFEETIYLMPSAASVATQQRIEAAVGQAAQAIGLFHGPIHAECRVNGDRVYVLEVAARPIGGLCAKSLRFDDPSGGVISLEELLLLHALGHDVAGYRRERPASGVMMIPIPRRGIFKRVEGEAEAAAMRHIDAVTITAKPDAMLVPLPEGKSYLGFIFAHAPEVRDVETALREAHRRLNFVIDREVAVVP